MPMVVTARASVLRRARGNPTSLPTTSAPVRYFPNRGSKMSSSSTQERQTGTAGIDSPVQFESNSAVRTFKLNRPKAFNALNGEMVDLLQTKIQEWNRSEFCKVLLGTGGDKAFCSGGDVKAIALMAMGGKLQEAIDYFKAENELDYQLATCSKPYVVIMDGITMGGGAGLAYGAPLRVATPDTQFAMPETIIGFAPDVGAQFYLAQLDGYIGAWMAVTGQTVYGRAVYELGLATHYVSKASIPHIIHTIQQSESPTLISLASSISSHSAPPPSSEARALTSSRNNPDSPSGLVGDIRDLIDSAFSRRTVSEIHRVLEQAISDETQSSSVRSWAQEQLKVMQERSPTGMKVALAGFHLAKQERNLWLQLNRDLAMCQAFLKSPEREMITGIRALLIDKPKTPPVWNPKKLDDPKIEESSILREWYDRRSSGLLQGAPMLEGKAIVEELRGAKLWGAFRAWGLPEEKSIEGYVKGSAKSSDAFALTHQELEERLINDMAKQWETGYQDMGQLMVGIREKISEVVRRKCRPNEVDGKVYLQWKSDKHIGSKL